MVIKSSKAGMNIYLDPGCTHEEILRQIALKFKESAKFWGNVQMTLLLEGRSLTPNEELDIINTITDNSSIEILCLIDQDAKRIERCEKTLNDKLLELSCNTGQFYKGTLTRGETIEVESSIVVIGDVHHGAHIMAKGNVIILGELRGSVHAGIAGNDATVIVATTMYPLQLKIADVSKQYGEKGRRLGKGPMIACVESNQISTKYLKKNIFDVINFN